jgi:hypothetical protein
MFILRLLSLRCNCRYLLTQFVGSNFSVSLGSSSCSPSTLRARPSTTHQNVTLFVLAHSHQSRSSYWLSGSAASPDAMGGAPFVPPTSRTAGVRKPLALQTRPARLALLFRLGFVLACGGVAGERCGTGATVNARWMNGCVEVDVSFVLRGCGSSR